MRSGNRSVPLTATLSLNLVVQHMTSIESARLILRRRTCAVRTNNALLGAVLAMTVTSRGYAQSAQAHSAQIAALVTTIRPGTGSITGAGIEPQFRFNRIYSTEKSGAISLGIGAQYTLHSGSRDRMQVAGVFVEPRWALPFSAGCAYPYVAARFAALHVVGEFRDSPDGGTNGVSVGVGPGVAFRLTPTANLDAGVQLSHQQFGSIGAVRFGGSTTYAAKVGVTIGLPR